MTAPGAPAAPALLDPSLSAVGRSTINPGADETVWALSAGPGGSVVVAGRTSLQGDNAAATRLDASRVLDRGFGGGDGIAPFGGAGAEAGVGLGGKGLMPGRYRATATAVDRAGNRSAASRVSSRVVTR